MILHKTALFSIGALREAVRSFVDIVKQDDEANLTDESGHHRLGLAKFANGYSSNIGNEINSNYYNLSQPLMTLASVNEFHEEAKLLMDKLLATGGTYTNNGMHTAKDLFDNAVDDGKEREKTLVVFTTH